MPRGLLVMGFSLTPLHPGSGRTPGVVDLPVIRDSIGYPFIPASGLKGALKSLCARLLCKGSQGKLCIDDRGRIDLSKCDEEERKRECKICLCLFGPEPGEGDEGSAALALLDMVPIAFPIASADYGYLYISTPYLLTRASMVAEALGKEDLAEVLAKLAEYCRSYKEGAVTIFPIQQPLVAHGPASVDLGGTSIAVKTVSLDENEKNVLRKYLDSLGGLAKDLLNRLVIVPDNGGVNLIEKSLLKVTRIRVRRDRKVVAEGGLWTEEYIPAGTIFVGGVVVVQTTNKYCRDCGADNNAEKVITFLVEKVLKPSAKGISYIVIGGKETIGKGILKLYIER